MKCAESGPTSVVARVVAILSSFSHGQPDRGISEISRETGLALSTTHRLVNELTRCGALHQTDAHRYTVGPKVADLAHAIRRRSDMAGLRTQDRAEPPPG
jgi:DNA-binding IclR family transcriptional regulator